MKQYYDLTSGDDRLLPCVFKEFSSGKLTVRPRYKKYACLKCGRIDAGKALKKAGLDPEFEADTGKRHRRYSYDYMSVIDTTLRRLFEDHCDDVLYYDIQDKGDHFVIWPKHLVIPDDSDTYDRTHKCGTCGFFRSIVFGPDIIRSFLDIIIGAVLLEAPQGPNPYWFVDDVIAKQIKKNKLKGINLKKWILP